MGTGARPRLGGEGFELASGSRQLSSSRDERTNNKTQNQGGEMKRASLHPLTQTPRERYDGQFQIHLMVKTLARDSKVCAAHQDLD